MKRSLNKVSDPQGRLDVLLYQLAGRAMERLERERGWIGIRENFLPLIEETILANVPRERVIPRELRAFLRTYEQNRRRV